MGRILYLDDPNSNSKAFIVEPDITQEENEINKRKVELAAKNCARQAYKEFLEQKDWGVAEWEKYLDQQLSKYPKKPNNALVEVTEEEMNKMIYG